MKKRVQRNKRRTYRNLNIKLFTFLFLIIFIVVYTLQITPNMKKHKYEHKDKNITSYSSIKSNTSNKSNWMTSKNQNQLPILMFHYVTSRAEQLPQDSNNIDIVTFENELKMLKEEGYTTVSGLEAEKILTSKHKPNNKIVWLTFDDGSITMYTEVFPLLKKYNMHATNFVITGFVNNSQGGILNWEQINEMKSSGLVDFGSHTVSHLSLEQLNLEEQRVELEQSKNDLDKHLNQNTNMICYPAGGYSQITLNLAEELGYKFGLLDPGRNGAIATSAKEGDGLLTLPRFRMMNSTSAEEMIEMIRSATEYNKNNK